MTTIERSEHAAGDVRKDSRTAQGVRSDGARPTDPSEAGSERSERVASGGATNPSAGRSARTTWLRGSDVPGRTRRRDRQGARWTGRPQADHQEAADRS